MAGELYRAGHGRNRSGVCVEGLESRRLLSGVSVHINFQPVKAATPAGYLTDNGAVFADRGNGYSYGWNGPRPDRVVAQQSRKFDGPDVRYDTFAALNRRGPGTAWMIVLPNGTYNVHIVSGSPLAASGSYKVIANGVMVVNGKATRAARWVEGTQQVTVADNVLLVMAGPKSNGDKIDFIDIDQVVSSAGSTSAPNPPAGGGSSTGGSGSGGSGTSGSGSGGSSTGGSSTGGSTSGGPGSSGTSTGGSSGGTSSGGSSSGGSSSFPTSLNWQKVASSPVALLEAQSAVADGKLYVFGGYNVDSPNFLATTRADSYDPTTNTWTRLADMPEPLTHIGVATDGQYIYLAGGYVTDYTTSYQTFGTRDIWRYDIANNTWSAFTPLPVPRAAGALVLLNGELHYIDGVDPTRATHADHFVLNLADPSAGWVSSTPLPFGRNHMTAVALDGKIYAIGGQSSTNDSAPNADVVMWDPNNPGVWQTVASLPQPRSHAVTTVADGRIIVAGGATTGDVALASVIDYDPATNSWGSLTPVPDPRLAPAGGFLDGELIVTTGDYQGLQADTWIAPIG